MADQWATPEPNAAIVAGTPLKLAQRGWVLLAAAATCLLVIAIPGFLSRRPMGGLGSHMVFDPSPAMLAAHRVNIAAMFIGVLVAFGLALLLFMKRREDGMALFVAYYLLTHGLLYAGTVEMLEPIWPDAVSANSFYLQPLITLPMTVTLFSVFPDGRFIPGWTQWLPPLAVLLGLEISSQQLFPGLRSTGAGVGPLELVEYLGIGAIVLALIAAQVTRYRRVSSRLQRQQTKWVLFSFLVMIGVYGMSVAPWNYVLSLPQGSRMPWWVPLGESTWVLASLSLPVALTISVLRYRLYDVDTLLNRTAVYAGLSVCVIGLYALIVGGLGSVFHSSGNLILSLLATGLAAVLFDPLRRRLQGAVNRLMYGERDEPFAVLRRLGQRLETSSIPEDILRVIVETVAQALKLPYAEITIRQGETFEQAARSGHQTSSLMSFPAQYQGKTIGQLSVALRGPGEVMVEADQALLRQIARQAAPFIHAVQLTRDLRLSHARTVNAREEERQRLRRDLHDGLGPVLASQGLKIAAAAHLMETNPEKAKRILDELASQNEAAVSEVRRLVYALRPPELDELGLVGVIREYVSELNVDGNDGTAFVVVAHPSRPEPKELPAGVEVAAYRIITEALTNVTRHARARHCAVRFEFDTGNQADRFEVEIEDDGIGIGQEARPGIGVISMRERAAEVGGELVIDSSQDRGTKIIASFPLAG